MSNGEVTAAPDTVSCCPDTQQWDANLGICRDFTTNDSCGPNFDVLNLPSRQILISRNVQE